MRRRRGFGWTQLNRLRSTARMAIVRRFAVVASVALLLSGAGCRKQDPITHYRAPKDPSWRMVAALVPAKQETWFFKMVGPSTRIADGKDEFIRFIQSLSIAESVTWKLSEGWTDEAGAGGPQTALPGAEGVPRSDHCPVRAPGAGVGGVGPP